MTPNFVSPNSKCRILFIRFQSCLALKKKEKKNKLIIDDLSNSDFVYIELEFPLSSILNGFITQVKTSFLLYKDFASKYVNC